MSIEQAISIKEYQSVIPSGRRVPSFGARATIGRMFDRNHERQRKATTMQQSQLYEEQPPSLTRIEFAPSSEMIEKRNWLFGVIPMDYDDPYEQQPTRISKRSRIKSAFEDKTAAWSNSLSAIREHKTEKALLKKKEKKMRQKMKKRAAAMAVAQESESEPEPEPELELELEADSKAVAALMTAEENDKNDNPAATKPTSSSSVSRYPTKVYPWVSQTPIINQGAGYGYRKDSMKVPQPPAPAEPPTPNEEITIEVNGRRVYVLIDGQRIYGPMAARREFEKIEKRQGFHPKIRAMVAKGKSSYHEIHRMVDSESKQMAKHEFELKKAAKMSSVNDAISTNSTTTTNNDNDNNGGGDDRGGDEPQQAGWQANLYENVNNWMGAALELVNPKPAEEEQQQATKMSSINNFVSNDGKENHDEDHSDQRTSRMVDQYSKPPPAAAEATAKMSSVNKVVSNSNTGGGNPDTVSKNNLTASKGNPYAILAIRKVGTIINPYSGKPDWTGEALINPYAGKTDWSGESKEMVEPKPAEKVSTKISSVNNVVSKDGKEEHDEDHSDQQSLRTVDRYPKPAAAAEATAKMSSINNVVSNGKGNHDDDQQTLRTDDQYSKPPAATELAAEATKMSSISKVVPKFTNNDLKKQLEAYREVIQRENPFLGVTHTGEGMFKYPVEDWREIAKEKARIFDAKEKDRLFLAATEAVFRLEDPLDAEEAVEKGEAVVSFEYILQLQVTITVIDAAIAAINAYISHEKKLFNSVKKRYAELQPTLDSAGLEVMARDKYNYVTLTTTRRELKEMKREREAEIVSNLQRQEAEEISSIQRQEEGKRKRFRSMFSRVKDNYDEDHSHQQTSRAVDSAKEAAAIDSANVKSQRKLKSILKQPSHDDVHNNDSHNSGATSVKQSSWSRETLRRIFHRERKLTAAKLSSFKKAPPIVNNIDDDEDENEDDHDNNQFRSNIDDLYPSNSSDNPEYDSSYGSFRDTSSVYSDREPEAENISMESANVMCEKKSKAILKQPTKRFLFDDDDNNDSRRKPKSILKQPTKRFPCDDDNNDGRRKPKSILKQPTKRFPCDDDNNDGQRKPKSILKQPTKRFPFDDDNNGSQRKPKLVSKQPSKNFRGQNNDATSAEHTSWSRETLRRIFQRERKSKAAKISSRQTGLPNVNDDDDDNGGTLARSISKQPKAEKQGAVPEDNCDADPRVLAAGKRIYGQFRARREASKIARQEEGRSRFKTMFSRVKDNHDDDQSYQQASKAVDPPREQNSRAAKISSPHTLPILNDSDDDYDDHNYGATLARSTSDNNYLDHGTLRNSSVYPEPKSEEENTSMESANVICEREAEPISKQPSERFPFDDSNNDAPSSKHTSWSRETLRRIFHRERKPKAAKMSSPATALPIVDDTDDDDDECNTTLAAINPGDDKSDCESLTDTSSDDDDTNEAHNNGANSTGHKPWPRKISSRVFHRGQNSKAAKASIPRSARQIVEDINDPSYGSYTENLAIIRLPDPCPIQDTLTAKVFPHLNAEAIKALDKLDVNRRMFERYGERPEKIIRPSSAGQFIDDTNDDDNDDDDDTLEIFIDGYSDQGTSRNASDYFEPKSEAEKLSIGSANLKSGKKLKSVLKTGSKRADYSPYIGVFVSYPDYQSNTKNKVRIDIDDIKYYEDDDYLVTVAKNNRSIADGATVAKNIRSTADGATVADEEEKLTGTLIIPELLSPLPAPRSEQVSASKTVPSHVFKDMTNCQVNSQSKVARKKVPFVPQAVDENEPLSDYLDRITNGNKDLKRRVLEDIAKFNPASLATLLGPQNADTSQEVSRKNSSDSIPEQLARIPAMDSSFIKGRFRSRRRSTTAISDLGPQNADTLEEVSKQNGSDSSPQQLVPTPAFNSNFIKMRFRSRRHSNTANSDSPTWL